MAITQVPNSLLTQPVNHNILINPSFTVFQRAGTTDSGAWGVDHEGTGGSFGPDRWRIRGLDAVGGTMLQSTTDSSSGINKMVVEHDGAINESYTYQHIETVNLLGLYGKEMTFSFSYSDVGGSGIPLAWITAWDSSGTSKELFNAVPTSLGNNRWACTFTLTTNDGTIPDLSERGMQVVIEPNGGNTAPDEWSVWETKLEAGSVATPFVARSYGEELALCQRYYQPIYKYGGMAGSARLSTYVYMAYTFPVAMRTSPSLILNGLATIVGNDGFTQSTDQRNNISGASNTGCRLQLMDFTGLTIGNAYVLGGSTATDTVFMFDAEM